MVVSFRRAVRADLSRIVELLADDAIGALRECVASPIDVRYEHAFTEIDADPRQQLIVAESGEGVVGVLQLSVIPGLSRCGARRGQIEGVRVAFGRRGSGVGSMLINHAIEEARSCGCRLVQLTTDRRRADAAEFYARLGFSASHLGLKLELSEV